MIPFKIYRHGQPLELPLHITKLIPSSTNPARCVALLANPEGKVVDHAQLRRFEKRDAYDLICEGFIWMGTVRRFNALLTIDGRELRNHIWSTLQ
jgi:hypothetical protein